MARRVVYNKSSMCKCGHRATWHTFDIGACDKCDCPRFQLQRKKRK